MNHKSAKEEFHSLFSNAISLYEDEAKELKHDIEELYGEIAQIESNFGKEALDYVENSIRLDVKALENSQACKAHIVMLLEYAHVTSRLLVESTYLLECMISDIDYAKVELEKSSQDLAQGMDRIEFFEVEQFNEQVGNLLMGLYSRGHDLVAMLQLNEERNCAVLQTLARAVRFHSASDRMAELDIIDVDRILNVQESVQKKNQQMLKYRDDLFSVLNIEPQKSWVDIEEIYASTGAASFRAVMESLTIKPTFTID